MTDGGENGCRGMLWSRDEFEIFRACRPTNGRVVYNEIRVESVLFITKMNPLQYAAPMHVEGDIRRYGRAMHQGIHNVVVVPDLYVAEFHRCCCIIEIDFYTVIGSAYRPEKAAGSDAGIEVMNLICRGNLSLIEVQSYEAERSLVLFSVYSDVSTLHEAHIHVEEQGRSCAGAYVCSCSRSLDFSTAN